MKVWVCIIQYRAKYYNHCLSFTARLCSFFPYTSDLCFHLYNLTIMWCQQLITATTHTHSIVHDHEDIQV